MAISFSLGRLLITPGALKTLVPASVPKAISRHASGDWGDVDTHDARANERALLEGSRLFSVYHDGNGTKFWIITEADRSATTILLPEEY